MNGAIGTGTSYDRSSATLHWRLFADAQREGRAIHPSRDRGAHAFAVLKTEAQFRAFVEKYSGTHIVCVSVNPAPDDYKGGNALSDKHIERVTRLFLDFDPRAKDDPPFTDEQCETVIKRLKKFVAAKGWAPWVFAKSGRGVHAYVAVPEIDTSEHQDIGQRIAYLTGVVLKRELSDLAWCKTDSVYNLSRVCKVTGTFKPETPNIIGHFTDKNPKLTDDAALREWLLKVKLEAPAEADANADADDAETDAAIELAVEGSSYLRNLVASIGKPGADRSRLEFALARELWIRGFRNAKRVALFRVKVARSKAKEQGFSWAFKDTLRIFKGVLRDAKYEDELPASERPTLDKLAPRVAAFLAQEIPAVRWLVPGLLAQGMRALFAGEPKTLKSWAWIYLALHTSNLKHTTLYLAGEGHVSDWRNRLQTIAKGHGISIHNVDPFLRFALRPGINLLDRDSLLWVRQYVLDEQPSLLIVDTLRSQFLGDENDSKEVGTLISNLDWLVQDVPADRIPTLAIVHHTRKSHAGGDTSSAGSRVRGSGAFWGHVDTVIVSKKPKKVSDDLLIRREVQLEVDHRFADGGDYAQIVEFDVSANSTRVEFKRADSEGVVARLPPQSLEGCWNEYLVAHEGNQKISQHHFESWAGTTISRDSRRRFFRRTAASDPRLIKRGRFVFAVRPRHEWPQNTRVSTRDTARDSSPRVDRDPPEAA